MFKYCPGLQPRLEEDVLRIQLKTNNNKLLINKLLVLENIVKFLNTYRDYTLNHQRCLTDMSSEQMHIFYILLGLLKVDIFREDTANSLAMSYCKTNLVDSLKGNYIKN